MDAINSLDLRRIHTRALSNACRIESFRCGEREIDGWVQNRARSYHDKNKAIIFCARQEDNGTILGFYDLSFTSRVVDANDRKSEGVPLIYISYFAVLRSHQGQGLGTILLMSALRRVHAVAVNVAVYGVALRSLNGRTTDFYARQGFAPRDNHQHPFMVLPVWDPYDLFGKPCEQVPVPIHATNAGTAPR
jgi:GNAT superfamily N-acetyltransferase